MMRETKEELNIELERKDLKIEHVLHHYKGNRVKFIISSNNYSGDLKIGEPDKCEKIEWFDLNNLPNNVYDKARKVLEEIQKGIFYDKATL